jgi:hypothetical protein
MRFLTPAGLGLFVMILCAPAAPASTLTRDADPVVLTGADLPWFLGLGVDRIVAFRWVGGLGWVQIPVQVDERKYADYGDVYNQGAVGAGRVDYADPDTYCGADPDPTFDADDELVFAAKDAGERADYGVRRPNGVDVNSGVQVRINDPLDGGIGYVYLFESYGTLPQDAGEDYVTYTFDLLSGPYIPTYNTTAGPNPENSTATSAFYRTHFADRWIRDEINVYAGAATGVDIFDRHKNLFAPGNCTRSEDTFSDGEGAFFANVDGPVRGIRSYMGANSGPATQRVHYFYEKRHDMVTYLRVHSISGVMDLYDYSPAATGMTYANDLNPAGVLVDGVPDVVTTGLFAWEMVTGLQGTLTMSEWIDTDIAGLTPTSYYSDDATPSVTQCTGDAFEYATSGVWINQGIPNTDPLLGATNFLNAVRVVYYDPPGQTVPDAETRDAQARTPLTHTVTQFVRPPWDFDYDGDVDLSDYGVFLSCYNGPANPPAQAGCDAADADGDGDVDLTEYGEFLDCYNGPNNPPAC